MLPIAVENEASEERDSKAKETGERTLQGVGTMREEGQDTTGTPPFYT